jgi:UV DNA damage endonuclease
MRKESFLQYGVTKCGDLGEKNLRDLLTILHWNVVHDIPVFRIGSGILPWGEQYHLEDLPNYDTIVELGERVHEIVVTHGLRISFHPDHFVKLGSKNPMVVETSLQTLRYHDDLLTLFRLPATHDFPLNIHVGERYSPEVVERFLSGFSRLSPTTRRRLVVENDDKASMFSVNKLADTLYRDAGIPITFDAFHHTFHPDGLSLEDAYQAANITWGTTRPLFHYSESKTQEGWTGNPRAHAEYVQDFSFVLSHTDVDWDIEAKAKELALAPLQHRSTNEHCD